MRLYPSLPDAIQIVLDSSHWAKDEADFPIRHEGGKVIMSNEIRNTSDRWGLPPLELLRRSIHATFGAHPNLEPRLNRFINGDWAISLVTTAIGFMEPKFTTFERDADGRWVCAYESESRPSADDCSDHPDDIAHRRAILDVRHGEGVRLTDMKRQVQAALLLLSPIESLPVIVDLKVGKFSGNGVEIKLPSEQASLLKMIHDTPGMLMATIVEKRKTSRQAVHSLIDRVNRAIEPTRFYISAPNGSQQAGYRLAEGIQATDPYVDAKSPDVDGVDCL
jgi:hypothetical protein